MRSEFYPNLFQNAPCSLKTRTILILGKGGLLPDHDTLVGVSNPNADKGSKANVATHARPAPWCNPQTRDRCGHNATPAQPFL